MPNNFTLYSYNKKEGNNIVFGSISISFGENGIILRDGYEHGYDGSNGYTTISETENYYKIDTTEFKNLISIMADGYKNKGILTEYKNANTYYDILTVQEEKILFLIFLHYFKSETKIDKFIKILEEHSIHYKHERSGY